MVLKHFLRVFQINDPYLGGLSSYGLILMIVAFIQYYDMYLHDRVNYPVNTTDIDITPGSIINLMTEMLSTYNKYDILKIVITPKHPQINYDHSISPIYQKQHEDGVIHIIDPLNTNNNVGKSSYNTSEIKSCFETIHNNILKSSNEQLKSDYDLWISTNLKID